MHIPTEYLANARHEEFMREAEQLRLVKLVKAAAADRLAKFTSKAKADAERRHNPESADQN